jgi:hypothetical protein
MYATGAVESMDEPAAHVPREKASSDVLEQNGKPAMDTLISEHPTRIAGTFPTRSATLAKSGLPKICRVDIPM